MAKKVLKRKLGRKKDARNMLIRNLATSLVLYERIKTTLPKAKMLKPRIENLFHKVKTLERLQAKRILGAYFLDQNATKKTFEIILPELKKHNRILRIYKLGLRKGDAAQTAVLELILPKIIKESSKKSKDEKTSQTAPEKSLPAAKEKTKGGITTKIRKKR